MSTNSQDNSKKEDQRRVLPYQILKYITKLYQIKDRLFNKWYWKNWLTVLRKWNLYLSPCTKCPQWKAKLEENIDNPFIVGFQEDSLRKMQQAQNIMGRVPLNHIKSQGSIH